MRMSSALPDEWGIGARESGDICRVVWVGLSANVVLGSVVWEERVVYDCAGFTSYRLQRHSVANANKRSTRTSHPEP